MVQMMKAANVLSVPVLGPGSKQFSGCFSITDVLKALVTTLRLEIKRNSFDMGGDDAAAALKRIYEDPVSKIMHAGDLWYLQGARPHRALWPVPMTLSMTLSFAAQA